MRNTLSMTLLAGIVATSAQATHLGPIEYGKERVEPVTYCLNRDDSLFAITEEMKAIQSGETFEDYSVRIAPYVQNLKCGLGNIRYTPLEGICEGKSYVKYPDGRVETKSTRIIKAISGKTEFYVHVGDEVPKKLPSCLGLIGDLVV